MRGGGWVAWGIGKEGGKQGWVGGECRVARAGADEGKF